MASHYASTSTWVKAAPGRATTEAVAAGVSIYAPLKAAVANIRRKSMLVATAGKGIEVSGLAARTSRATMKPIQYLYQFFNIHKINISA